MSHLRAAMSQTVHFPLRINAAGTDERSGADILNGNKWDMAEVRKML